MNGKKTMNDGIAVKCSILRLFRKKESTEKKEKGRKFENIYVKFKDDCVEMSDWEDFRMLIYIPYTEIEKIEWVEKK